MGPLGRRPSTSDTMKDAMKDKMNTRRLRIEEVLTCPLSNQIMKSPVALLGNPNPNLT